MSNYEMVAYSAVMSIAIHFVAIRLLGAKKRVRNKAVGRKRVSASTMEQHLQELVNDGVNARIAEGRIIVG